MFSANSMCIVFNSFIGGTVHLGGGILAKIGRGSGRRLKIHLVGGRLREFSRRDAGCHNVMITSRWDVGKKQVWDAGFEGKNVWVVGIPITKARDANITK